MDELFKAGQFDMVINMAAQAGVRHSIKNPKTYILSNVVGFGNILETCRNFSIKHLVYASSSNVYGLNKNIPFSTNDNADHPVSLYGATKRSNELMAHSYSHLYNIPTTGLRFFTVYGPWGRPDMAYCMFADAIINDKRSTFLITAICSAILLTLMILLKALQKCCNNLQNQTLNGML